jgi:DNA-binding NtrC family response regulator
MSKERARILLVDTEESWLQFSRQALERAGYAVETASEDRDLEELLAASGSRFDLILIDSRYAERDGGLLGTLARSTFREPCIVVLFPTQMTPQQMIRFFRTRVVHDCVDKQYEEESLLTLVRTQLAQCASVACRASPDSSSGMLSSAA